MKNKPTFINAFYKQAVEKGIITAPIDNVLERAKASKPTGLLTQDLTRLAAELKDNGFTKEAESLNEKLAKYKTATTEYAKILQDAHPAKDESDDIRGLVETHQAMEQAARAPKAKVNGPKISKAESLLNATGKMLDVKTAQDIKEDNLGLEPEVSTVEGKKDEAAVNKCNSFVIKHFSSLNESIEKISAASPFFSGKPSDFLITAEKLAKPSESLYNFYTNLNKIDTGLAALYLLVKSLLYKGAEPTEEATMELFSNVQANEGSLKDWCERIAPKAARAFTGSVPFAGSKDIEKNYPTVVNDPKFAPNKESIWQFSHMQLNEDKIYYKIYPENVGKVAANLWQAVVKLKSKVVNDVFISKCNEKISSEIGTTIRNFSFVASLKEPDFKSREEIVQYNQKLVNSLYSLNNILANKKLSEYSNILGVPYSTDDVVKNVSLAVSVIKNMTTYFENFMSAEEMTVNVAKAHNLAAQIQKTLIDKAANLRQTDPKSIAADNLDYNANLVLQIKQSLFENKASSSKTLLDSLSKVYPGLKSIQDLENKLSVWLTDLQKTASAFIDLKKVAQAPPGAKGPGSKAPGATSSAKPGSASGTFSGKASEAVESMQISLGALGTVLMSPTNKFINMTNELTLEKCKNDGNFMGQAIGFNTNSTKRDGVWGPKTNEALQHAQKYVSAVNAGTIIVNKRDDASANQNSKLIESAMAKAGEGSGKGAAKAWNISFPYAGKDASISNTDVSSLENVYGWFLKNGFIKEEDTSKRELNLGGGDVKTSGGVGVKASAFGLYLNSLFKVAERLAVGDPEPTVNNWLKPNASEANMSFYQQAYNLFIKFSKFMQAYSGGEGANRAVLETVIVNKAILKNIDNNEKYKSSGSNGGAGSGGAGGAAFSNKGRPGKSNSSAGGLDGEDIDGEGNGSGQAPIALTSKMTINLDLPCYSNLQTEYGYEPGNRLHFATFKNSNVSSLATNLFANYVASEEVIGKNILDKHMRDSTYRWEPSISDYVITDRNTLKPIQAKTIKGYPELLQKYRALNPLEMLRRFLNSLSATLNKSVGAWSPGKSEDDIAKEGEYKQYWQDAIQSKLAEAAQAIRL